MLHMERNNCISGNSLAGTILRLLQQRLPRKWTVLQTESPSTMKPRPDFFLDLTGPHGERARIGVMAKASVEPKDVTFLAEQLRGSRKAWGDEIVPLIAAPFLSLSTRQRLLELDIPYADTTGNIRIFTSRPAIFIETQGAERNPNRTERPARSLKGAKAGRIVRALCDLRPPFGVRALAEETGINPGYVSRVLTFLETEALVRREPRGPITEVAWRKLIERWARDYSFIASNRVISYLEPRDIAGAASRLAAAAKRAAITGSAAAACVAPVAPTRLLAAYVESPEEVAKDLGLRPAESGANVLLAEPYDKVVFDRTDERDGTPYVALSQAAVDLLSGPGRNPSEAHALLDWMQANESAWRR